MNGRSHDNDNTTNVVHPDYIHNKHIHTIENIIFFGCKVLNLLKENAILDAAILSPIGFCTITVLG